MIMKESTISNRLHRFVSSMLDSVMEEEKVSANSHPGKELRKIKHERPKRREFFFYTQLLNNDTLEVVGHLADISSGGFKLDSQNPIPINKEIRFIMNLASSIANKSFMEFTARSRWCKVDPLDPFSYNVGFQLVSISPEDLEIFNRMMEKYGRDPINGKFTLRNSNKW